jgi:hypothetical protein
MNGARFFTFAQATAEAGRTYFIISKGELSSPLK